MSNIAYIIGLGFAVGIIGYILYSQLIEPRIMRKRLLNFNNQKGASETKDKAIHPEEIIKKSDYLTEMVKNISKELLKDSKSGEEGKEVKGFDTDIDLDIDVDLDLGEGSLEEALNKSKPKKDNKDEDDVV